MIAGSCGCCEPLREDGEPRIGLQSESYGYGRLLLPVVIGWYQHTFFDVLVFVSHKRNALAFWDALVEDASISPYLEGVHSKILTSLRSHVTSGGVHGLPRETLRYWSIKTLIITTEQEVDQFPQYP